jgi:hypothetical protein
VKKKKQNSLEGGETFCRSERGSTPRIKGGLPAGTGSTELTGFIMDFGFFLIYSPRSVYGGRASISQIMDEDGDFDWPSFGRVHHIDAKKKQKTIMSPDRLSIMARYVMPYSSNGVFMVTNDNTRCVHL